MRNVASADQRATAFSGADLEADCGDTGDSRCGRKRLAYATGHGYGVRAVAELISSDAEHSSEPLPGRVTKGLYERLSGADWTKLPRAIRQAHDPEKCLRAGGRFNIERGSSIAARVLCNLLRMPPSALGVPTVLQITSDAHGQLWVRTFGQYEMRTQQMAGASGLLVERFILLDFFFHLRGEEKGLQFIQRRASFRVGPLVIPLPRWLAPEVSACVRSAPESGTMVEVSVALPLLGFLICYHGRLEEPHCSP